MAKLSRKGIAYDLTISPYRESLVYEDNHSIYEVEYIFSSQSYKLKFLSRLGENRAKINESLSNRFGIKIKNEVLSDIVLYSKIEKRGFLIIVNGVSVECQEHITLDGKNPIISN